MNCPACQTVMREREKENVIVDICPNCRGMWLDHGELEKLVEIESERSGKYRKYYDDDDDDDDRRPAARPDDRRPDDRRDYESRGSSQQPYPQKKKKGFLSNLMETFGGEGAED